MTTAIINSKWKKKKEMICWIFFRKKMYEKKQNENKGIE